MKYMGSKRSMLKNGLGELILANTKQAGRFVDLFCGASSVAWFVAEQTELAVLAVDLQSYAVVLAKAVIERTESLDCERLSKKWFKEVENHRKRSKRWQDAIKLESEYQGDINGLVNKARTLCQKRSAIGPAWNAYGGYYFGPSQALTFDYLARYLPNSEPEYSVCLAAVISAAIKCVASPGHTAQPFRPTKTAARFICEAWIRDPLVYCQKALDDICPRYAQTTGKAIVANALNIAHELKPNDLVFVDPPYSGVQYSRFYHVLETIARGKSGPVEGAGRYPLIEERPQSSFSNKGQSKAALERLLKSLSEAKSTVIFTFPEGQCSNGLSGDTVIETAQNWFKIDQEVVCGRFSTLGGNNSHRASRQISKELILVMSP
jgi:adenine-specific DNA-methyltransferase